jgi:hypothetical protein
MRTWFLNFKSALLRENKKKVWFASLKTLTNCQDCSESRTKFLSTFLVSHWSIFFCVQSWLAFRTVFSVTGGFWNNLRVTGQPSKSRNKLLEKDGVSERILQIISDFKEVSRNVLHKKTAKKVLTISALKKGLFVF